MRRTGTLGLVLLGALAVLLALMALAAPASAWTSPGGGNNYTMASLDTAAGGDVDPLTGTCHYRVQQTVTISAGDSLTIDAGCWLSFDNARNLTIAGALSVNGNQSAGVLFDSNAGVPAQGGWGGVTFAGSGALASQVSNLTIQWSTFGLRCLACQNLSVGNLYVELNSGDAVMLRDQASDIWLYNITQKVTVYASQSVVGINGAARVTAAVINGTGSADLVTLWNITDSSFAGPSVATGVLIAAAWIDNATNVSVSGIASGFVPAGFRITRSAGVTVAAVSIMSAATWALTATTVDRLAVANFTVTAGVGSGLSLDGITNSTLQAITLTTLMAGVWLVNSTSVAVSDSSGAALAPPLAVASSSFIWVNNSSYIGGDPAAVFLNASNNLSLARVQTLSGSNGFRVLGSVSVAFDGCTAVSSSGDGIQLQSSAGVSLNGTSSSANSRRGLWIVSSSNVSLSSSNLSGNQREGIFASASAVRIVNTVASSNLLDGLVLTNASTLNATRLTVVANSREGLWLVGGGGTLAGAAARQNGANGTRVEGAVLDLTDGSFENNSRYGLYFAPNASGKWAITVAGRVASNPAVLAGNLSASAGAVFSLLNTTVDLRGPGSAPYLFTFNGTSEFWLDRATLRTATGPDRYAIALSPGAALVAVNSTLQRGGRSGGAPAIGADGAAISLANVTLVNPFSEVLLSGASVGNFSDVSISGSSGTAIIVQSGASLVGEHLFIDAPGAEALLASGADVTLGDSSFTNGGADLIAADLTTLRLTNVTLSGGPAGGLALNGSSVLVAFRLSVDGVAGDALGLDGGSTADLTAFAASLYGGGALVASGGAVITLSGATASGGLYGVALDASSLSGTNLSVDGPSVACAWLTNGSSINVSGALLVNTSGYALAAFGATLVALTSSTLSSSGATALAANGTGVVTLALVQLTASGDGINLTGVGALTAASLNVVAGASAFRLDSSAGADLRALDLTAGVGGVALDATNASGLRLADSALHLVSGGAAGLRIASSAGVAIDNVTVDGAGPFVGVDAAGLTSSTLGHLTVLGGAAGLALSASTGITGPALLIDGALIGLNASAASGANFTNAVLRNLTAVGVAASQGSSVDLWTSSVAGVPTASGFEAVNATGSSTVRLFDTPAANTTFASSGLGRIEVWWTLRVLVRFGGSPLAAAPVQLFDRAGLLVWNQTSDGAGLTPAGPALELVDADGARAYASPFTANVTTPSGFGGSARFDLNASRTVTIDLGDIKGPNLEARTNVRTVVGRAYIFAGDIGDNDNVGITGYEWAFVNETGANVRLTGMSASYTFAAPGHYWITVTGFDAAGNRGAAAFDVWVNSPPFFVNLPGPADLVAIEGRLFTRTFAASDNDSSDLPLLAFTVDGPVGITMSGGTLSWTPALHGLYALTVYVSDGYDRTAFSFDVLVGSDTVGNRPPLFTSDPREDADVIDDYLYGVTAQDPDLSDTIVIQLVAGPAGMSFRQNGILPSGDLTWQPKLYYPRGVDAYNWSFNISLRAFDGRAFGYQNFTLRLRNPPDKAPEIVSLDNLTLGSGEQLTLDLRQFVRDEDDPSGPFTWAIVKPDDTAGASIGFDSSNATTLVVRAPDRVEGTHSFFVTFKVSDASGKSATKVVKVELRGPSTAEAAFPWLLLLILVGGVGAAFALATRQRAGLVGEDADGSPGRGPRGGEGGSAQTAVPAGAAGFPVYLEGAVLFDQSDTIIASAAAEGASLEDAFVLAPSKAREQRLPEGSLALSTVEGRDMALLREGDAVLAALGKFAGEPSPWLLDPMKAVLASVQARARELGASSLEKVGTDAGVEEALRGLLAVSAGASAASVAKYARESSLRVASVVEHVQGYLRLKVAVDNNSGQIAADVRLSVEHDEKVMRLERIEPATEERRDRVHLGNLRPGERKTLAFYFDPQICTRSFFNATVAWEDAAGAFHSTAMRTRAAEVVCPSFSTPRAANTAMLRRLLQEELSFRDSKYFRFPEQTSAEQVFEACKQAVLAQDVRLVKDFVAERPYRAEAWFYGETKAKGSPMAIWTAVFGTERVAQFSVASNNPASITGLLAELGRRLVDSRAGGGVGAPIETMAKAAAAAQVGDRATLLSKSQAGEAEGAGGSPASEEGRDPR